MQNLSFDDLRWLHLLWLVMGVTLVALWGVWQRQRALGRFAPQPLLARLVPRGSWVRPLVRIVLVCASLILLVAAMIGPRWGEVEQPLTRRGIDVMILLDVSRSMLARDVFPNRLERAKLSIRDDLLPALAGDRVGLIAFAGLALLKCPLTSDYGFFRLALEDATPESIPRGGTLIGDAIRKAAEAMDDKLDTYKVVLLITDGEDHDSFPVEAAAAAWKDHRIPIVPVALGDEREGARVPIPGSSGETYLEYRGQTVWSRANFDQLRQIAAASDLNRFVPAGTRDFDLGEIYRTAIVPSIEHKEQEEMRRIPRPSRFHPFAVGALALILLDSLLREGPRGQSAAIPARARQEAA